MKIVLQKIVTLFLFYMLFCATTYAQEKKEFSVSVVVKDKATNQILQGSTVKIASQKSKKNTTDVGGQITFSLIAGNYNIEVSHVGFAKNSLIIQLKQDTVIETSLVSQSSDLATVFVISNENKSKVLTSQVGLEKIDRKTALLMPAILGEVDIIKVLQLKPGIKIVGKVQAE